MRTISRSFGRFLRENVNFLAFLVGFLVFSVALGSYSLRVVGLVDGLVVMAVALYPYLRKV